MKKNYAFSLIELMISLITISCITAAFAPVISKRLSANSTMVSSGLGSITVKCQDKFGQYCELCYKTRCIVCTRNCLDNEYRDIPTCTCKNCNKYDANCISCDEEKCKKCKAGYILESGKCNLCPEGYSCNGGSSKTKCLKGTYAPQGSSTCKECNAGYYSDVDGAKTCSPCPKGTEAPNKNSTKCKNCEKGYYASAEGTKNCSLCSAGKYTNSEGLSQCSSCNAGYTSNSDRTGCDICQAGTYAPTRASEKCYPCKAGTAVDTKGATICSDCDLGTYSKEGANICSSCEYGKYQDEKKQSSCKPCNSGYTTNQMGSKSSSQCVKCPDECTQCRTQSECKDCISDYHLENGVCVADYTDEFYSSVGETTWTVPAGVTSIGFVVVGGGQPSGQGATTSGGSIVFNNSKSIELTGDYLALKGNSITVSLCGAGGSKGGGAWEAYGRTCDTFTGGNWCRDRGTCWAGKCGGVGGAGGSGTGSFTVNRNATKFNVVVGQVNGGYDPPSVNPLDGSNCSRGAGNDYCHGGTGAKGGGASSFTDGYTVFEAGGGGGGGGAVCARSSCKNKSDGQCGGWGGGSTLSIQGAGGARQSWCPTQCSRRNGWDGSQGGTLCGNSQCPSEYTNHPADKCGSGQNGHVKISWGNLTAPGQGGKSGGCYKGSLSVKKGDVCKIKVGSSGNISSISCNSGPYTSESSGRIINQPSDSTGGSGFKEKVKSCDTGGDYGKGGSGTSSSSPQPGTSGFVYTWKE